jgi:hypothetical protein
MTWRSPAWPIVQPTPLVRLADHRREYLDYEGPISNERGEVRQVASGTFTLQTASDNHYQIKTDTGLRLTLTRQNQTDQWTIEAQQG